MKIINKITSYFKKPKIEPPEVRAIVKLNDVAKENSIYDDENKIIEVTKGNKVTKIKYSESDVDALREQGIPVIEENYSEEYDFLEGVNFGGVETRR